jgi:hypothetical protein
LELLPPDEKPWFQTTYGFPVERYLGSYSNIVPLLDSKQELHHLSLRGSMFGKLANIPDANSRRRVATTIRCFSSSRRNVDRSAKRSRRAVKPKRR